MLYGCCGFGGLGLFCVIFWGWVHMGGLINTHVDWVYNNINININIYMNIYTCIYIHIYIFININVARTRRRV